MTQPAQSSGHEWKPSRVTDCCTCGWHCEPNSTYPECKKQWQAHAASVAQAAQPPYDDRDQSAVSAFEKWWLALASSDDPIVNELDSFNLSQQATVVTFCKRAFAAEDGLEAQNPLQVAAPEPRIEYELRIDTPEQVFTLFTLHPRDRIDQIRKLGYLDIEDGGETHVIPWHSITGFTYKERA